MVSILFFFLFIKKQYLYIGSQCIETLLMFCNLTFMNNLQICWCQRFLYCLFFFVIILCHAHNVASVSGLSLRNRHILLAANAINVTVSVLHSTVNTIILTNNDVYQLLFFFW